MESDTLSQPSKPSDVSLGDIYQCISSSLEDVEALLNKHLQTDQFRLKELFAHGALLGGKRLRPALVLLAGKAAGPINQRHVVTATVLELIHTATLIHDDVLDEAQVRRHVPTINAKWDTHTSILMGDYLFAEAFSLSATNGSTDLCKAIGEAAKRVCEGEMRQCSYRDGLSLNETEYIEILKGKTAELCRIGCLLGAQHSGATPEECEAMASFGENLGIAFQIADDWLDLWGTTSCVGKTLGTDADQGKTTLPLIRFMDTQPQLHSEIYRITSSNPINHDDLRNLLADSDAEEYTLSKAKWFASQAKSALCAFPPSDEVESLRRLVDFSIARAY